MTKRTQWCARRACQSNVEVAGAAGSFVDDMVAAGWLAWVEDPEAMNLLYAYCSSCCALEDVKPSDLATPEAYFEELARWEAANGCVTCSGRDDCSHEAGRTDRRGATVAKNHIEISLGATESGDAVRRMVRGLRKAAEAIGTLGSCFGADVAKPEHAGGFRPSVCGRYITGQPRLVEHTPLGISTAVRRGRRYVGDDPVPCNLDNSGIVSRKALRGMSVDRIVMDDPLSDPSKRDEAGFVWAPGVYTASGAIVSAEAVERIDGRFALSACGRYIMGAPVTVEHHPIAGDVSTARRERRGIGDDPVPYPDAGAGP